MLGSGIVLDRCSLPRPARVVSTAFDVSVAILKDPAGKNLPVPDPDSKLRIEYCPPKAGEYKLLLSSSTGDYFATASVDCNRFGPEGVKRLNKP